MFYKYPKTPRFDSKISYNDFSDKKCVIEEKVDGSCAAIHFDNDNLVLQSRGHVLVGGAREAQFNLFKAWASEHSSDLYNVLGNKYVMFGEWCYVKHRCFYDLLPSFFIEFDIFDKKNNIFLSTKKRKEIILNRVNSVIIVHEAQFDKINNFGQYIGKSNYKSDKCIELFETIMRDGMSKYYKYEETDMTNLMEGVYVKIEDDDKVIGRFKLLRDGFDKVRMDDEKWQRRPIFQNKVIK